MDVTIVIPTYNGAHKIPNLLDSLKSQTFTDFQIMIVIDGSTDNTIEVINRYKNHFKQLDYIVRKMVEEQRFVTQEQDLLQESY